MNFAIVGCGKIVRKHVHALRHLSAEEARLVAVCDRSVARADSVAQQTGARSYTNFARMLASPDIDVVSILTPSGQHAEQALAAIEAGKHVVIEKPISLRIADGERVLRRAAAAGRRVFVVKQNRFNPAVSRLRRELDTGSFGRPVLGTIRVRWRRDQSYYDADPWRGTRLQDGGVLANQAIHHIDLLQWCMGPVESVHACVATRLVDIEVEDTAAATLRFSSGALGIIEATTATRPADLEGSLSILGQRGTVIIGGFSADRAQVWKFSGRSEADEAAVIAMLDTPPPTYVSPHYQFLKNVVLAVREGRPAMVDGAEAMKSLRLVHALYESAETGREVRLQTPDTGPTMNVLGVGSQDTEPWPRSSTHRSDELTCVRASATTRASSQHH